MWNLTLKLLATRVVGGVAAKPNAWPWMVSFALQRSERLASHFCGGSILTAKYILTAAHCLNDMTKKQTILVVRTLNLTGIPQNRIVQNLSDATYYKHLEYDREKIINDIASIRLNRPLDLTNPSAHKTACVHIRSRITIHSFTLEYSREEKVQCAHLLSFTIEKFCCALFRFMIHSRELILDVDQFNRELAEEEQKIQKSLATLDGRSIFRRFVQSLIVSDNC